MLSFRKTAELNHNEQNKVMAEASATASVKVTGAIGANRNESKAAYKLAKVYILHSMNLRNLPLEVRLKRNLASSGSSAFLGGTPPHIRSGCWCRRRG